MHSDPGIELLRTVSYVFYDLRTAQICVKLVFFVAEVLHLVPSPVQTKEGISGSKSSSDKSSVFSDQSVSKTGVVVYSESEMKQLAKKLPWILLNDERCFQVIMHLN